MIGRSSEWTRPAGRGGFGGIAGVGTELMHA